MYVSTAIKEVVLIKLRIDLQVQTELQITAEELESSQNECNDLRGDLGAVSYTMDRQEAELAKTRDRDDLKRQLDDTRAQLSGSRLNCKSLQDRIKELETGDIGIGSLFDLSQDAHIEYAAGHMGTDENAPTPMTTYIQELEMDLAASPSSQLLGNAGPMSGSRQLEDEIRETVEEGNLRLALRESLSMGNQQVSTCSRITLVSLIAPESSHIAAPRTYVRVQNI